MDEYELMTKEYLNPTRAEVAAAVKNRRYKVGVEMHSYYKKFAICMISVFVIAMGLGIGIATYKTSQYYTEQIQTTTDLHVAQVHDLQSTIDKNEAVKAAEINELTSSYETRIDGLNEEIIQRDATIDEMQSEMDTLINSQISEFDAYRRFWYVFKDAPNDSGITMECLLYSLEQCKKWNINPDWLWHIYQVESEYTATLDNFAGSGARGLGQVMPSTGKSFWENILGHGKGTFRVEMLYDPMVNIEITTTHIGRDLANGSTWREAIKHYSGGAGDWYYNRCIEKAKAHGIDLGEYNYKYQ